MRIAALEIESYGGLTNYREEFNLPPKGGLVVVLGPNEAGKTTMLRFIQTLLFGNGELRGALTLESEGRRYSLRQNGRRQTLALIDLATGERLSSAELEEMLGGLDAKVYRSVFAFGLDELQQLQLLATSGIQEQIFSASVAGAGRNARKALARIDGEQKALLKPRASAVLNDLADELREAKRAAANAWESNRDYEKLKRLEAQLLGEIADKEQDQQARQAAQRQLEAVRELWPTWSKALAAERELEALGEVDAAPPGERHQADERLMAAATDIDELTASLSAYLLRRERCAAVAQQVRDADQRLTVLSGQLGVDLERHDLSEFNRGAGWRQQADETRRELARLERKRSGLEARLHNVQARLGEATDRLADLAEPSSGRSELEASRQQQEARLRGVEALQARLAERTQQVQAVQALTTGLATAVADRRRAVRWLGPTFGAAGLLLAAYFALPTSEPLAYLLVALAPTLLVLLRPRRARAGTPHTATPEEIELRLDDARASLAHLEGQLRDDLSSLGLVKEPGAVEVQQLLGAAQRSLKGTEAALAALAQHERAAASVSNLREELSGVRRELEELDGAETTVRADWAAWRSEQAVPDAVSPDGLDTYVSQLEEAVRLANVISAGAAELKGLMKPLKAFEAKIEQLHARVGVEGEPTKVSELVAAWEQRLAKERQRLQALERRQQELQQLVRDAENQLTARFGQHQDTARALLAAADPLGWSDRSAAAEAQLNELAEELNGEDGLRTQRAKVAAELQLLETSSDVAEHAAKVESLQTQMRTEARNWLVLKLAEGMIADNLKEYERTHVPEVLKQASEKLAAVTGGRYVSVHNTPSSVLRVVTADDQVLDAEQLSRGTQEQLYLSVRLGLIDHFAQQSGKLPLVMDDVLVNADPERAAELADILADAASRHQVIYLTCHPRTAALLRERVPGSSYVELERLAANAGGRP